MAKFLRSIDVYFTNREGRPHAELLAGNIATPEIQHLGWMYEHSLSPLQTNGISKVNCYFTDAEPDRPPEADLGIAQVSIAFDGASFLRRTPRERQAYYVDRLHAAMLRCAEQFGWNVEALEAAFRRIRNANYEFSFAWKRPLLSPDRRHKVQALIQAHAPARLYLIFSDRQEAEVGRVPISGSVSGPGAAAFALGKIGWVDAQSVEVRHKNGRDFWTCTLDGQLAFHHPRAEAGDPHGEYDLGRMYHEGQWVLPDREAGLTLIRSAAAKGFVHAVNFLNRLNRDGSSA